MPTSDKVDDGALDGNRGISFHDGSETQNASPGADVRDILEAPDSCYRRGVVNRFDGWNADGGSIWDGVGVVARHVDTIRSVVGLGWRGVIDGRH